MKRHLLHKETRWPPERKRPHEIIAVLFEAVILGAVTAGLIAVVSAADAFARLRGKRTDT